MLLWILSDLWTRFGCSHRQTPVDEGDAVGAIDTVGVDEGDAVGVAVGVDKGDTVIVNVCKN